LSTAISVISKGLTCQTAGLLHQLGYEICATVASSLLMTKCRDFVQFVGNYAAADNPIRLGETVRSNTG